MNRRQFLQFLLLASSIFSPSVEAKATNNNNKIIIIGAGLAGLAAAQKLTSAGCNVTILEARDRIGGRIHTSEKWADAPLDLGATWIHGERGNPITALADDINAKRVITSYDYSRIYNADGALLTNGQEEALEKLKEKFFVNVRKAQNGDIDISLQDIANKFINGYGRDSDITRQINFILNGIFEHEYAGAANKLSTFWHDDADIFMGDDALFVDGFKVITTMLARGLNIKLNNIVNKIYWQNSRVKIITNDKNYQADGALVTVPLGVLKSGDIEFQPALSNKKKQAIQGLDMGVLNKCYIRFPVVFWPENVDWLEYIPHHHGEWSEWVSLARVMKLPILLGFNAADYGRNIEKWADADIIENAMKTLQTIFGKNIPDPIDYQITRWAGDVFSYGSYSYNPVGSHPKMRADLARGDGNLFFAGEATHQKYFATAHGAYLSGLRAAEEMLK